MELFRVTLWDMSLIGSLNRGQWDVEADFAVTRAKVWLSESGPQEGHRPVRGPAGRDRGSIRCVELLAVVRADDRTGGPVAGKGVDGRAGLVRTLAPAVTEGPMQGTHWWLVCYDVRDPKRLRHGRKAHGRVRRADAVFGFSLLAERRVRWSNVSAGS